MAEAFLNTLAGDRFHAESAGLEPTNVSPLVLEVMREIGYDLSESACDDVFEFYRQGKLYDYVIAVCERETEQKCPIFPGVQRRLHWPFPDPDRLEGTYGQRLEETRKIRDDIRSRIISWIDELDNLV